MITEQRLQSRESILDCLERPAASAIYQTAEPLFLNTVHSSVSFSPAPFPSPPLSTSPAPLAVSCSPCPARKKNAAVVWTCWSCGGGGLGFQLAPVAPTAAWPRHITPWLGLAAQRGRGAPAFGASSPSQYTPPSATGRGGVRHYGAPPPPAASAGSGRRSADYWAGPRPEQQL